MDIDKPECLKKIADTHNFLMPELVQKEVQNKLMECGKHGNYHHVSCEDNIDKWDNRSYNPEVIIALYFSSKEKRYGEHEVIAHSLRIVYKNVDFCMILDDWKQQEWIKKNTNHLNSKMRWTTDFIKDCGCTSLALSKKECVDIIQDMERVPTIRIPAKKYAEIKKRINSC